MDLPAELLREITGLADLRSENVGHDRRRQPRVPLFRQGILWLRRQGKAGAAQIVQIRDIGAGGISLVHAEALRPGDGFVIHVPRQDGRPVKIQCTVQRCQPGGRGGLQFAVGAIFRRIIEPADSSSQSWREGSPVTIAQRIERAIVR